MKLILKLILALTFVGLHSEARDISKDQLSKVQQYITDTRVIGGAAVLKGSLPYQVSIQNTFGELVCGGSIIGKEWILTAAHCLDMPKQYLKVVTGTVNWKIPDAEYSIRDVKVHCRHDKPMYHNDIGLIRLNKPIIYNDRTQPIDLATSNTLKEGDNLLLSGWGSIKLWGRSPDLLQKAELHYVGPATCLKTVKNRAWLGVGNICTDTLSGNGACTGDSGGPLVDTVNNVLVGIVNWGEACAVGNPDVYASVAYYYEWIRNILAGGSAC